ELPPAALELASRLFNLARAGDTVTLASYLTAGIPSNLTNHEGNTLLMLASYSGHAETTQMLLDKGADPNVVNSKGQSPLAGAMFKGWDEVVSVLDRGGAERRAGQPNAEDCAIMFKRERWI
ncbi:ankyrin, partial [Pseudovirgaria hyperparasitica]